MNGCDLLTLRTLSNLMLTQPILAYLSACGTADVQCFDALDEATHLVGYFQAAGFPHVIGTFWEADHDVASEIAVSFYRSLAQAREGGGNMFSDAEGRSTSTVARALHQAVLEARDKDIEGPLGWANSVHFGH